MPVLPCQSLGICARQAVAYISKQSNYCSKRYTLFFLVLLEITSLILYNTLGKSYNDFWFAFLANNTILLLVYKDYCNRKILRYCQMTTVALRCLLTFYVLNSFVMSTGIFTGKYYNIVTYLLLTTAFILTLLTMYKTNK